MIKRVLLTTLSLSALLILASCEATVGASYTDDGICWYADSSLHLVGKVTADGDHMLLYFTDLVDPVAVAAMPYDGSCWIADPGAHEIVRINLDGVLMKRISGFITPVALAVDANGEQVWVVDSGTKKLYKLAPDGSILNTTSGLIDPVVVDIDPLTSEVWVADKGIGAIKYDFYGNEQTRVTGLGSVDDLSIDKDTGRVFVADKAGNRVICLDTDGSLLWVFTASQPTRVQAANGSTVWVIESGLKAIIRVGPDENGTPRVCSRVQNSEVYSNPISLSFRWKTDEVWVGDDIMHKITRNMRDGRPKLWIVGSGTPVSLSVYDHSLDTGKP